MMPGLRSGMLAKLDLVGNHGHCHLVVVAAVYRESELGDDEDGVDCDSDWIRDGPGGGRMCCDHDKEKR